MIEIQSLYESLKRCVEYDIEKKDTSSTFSFVLGLISGLEDTKQVLSVGADTAKLIEMLKKQ